jgi:uncharacterized membrane protein YqhA
MNSENQQASKMKKGEICINLSIIIINVNSVNFPFNNIAWFNGLKNKIQLFAVCNLTSLQRLTQIERKENDI